MTQDTAPSTTYTLPTLNVELLTNLITWAVADKKRLDRFAERFANWGTWKQSKWAHRPEGESANVCGTAFCIAGQAVVQVGYMPVFESPWDESASHCAPRVFAGLGPQGLPTFEPDRNEENHVVISDLAKTVLGLTSEESNALFYGDNTLGNVVATALLIANARQVALDLPDEAWTEFFDTYRDTDTSRRDLFSRFYFPQEYQDLVNGVERCQACGQTVEPKPEAVPF